MTRSDIAENFALAMLNIAKEQNKVEEYFVWFKHILYAFKANKKIVEILMCPNISKDERKKVVNAIFKGAPIYLINFFYLLIDKNVMKYIEQIMKILVHETNDYLKVMFLEIRTAYPLTDAETKKIVKAIEKKYSSKVEYRNIIDPTVIGGVKLSFASKTVDSTLQGRLKNLRKISEKGR